MSNSEKKPDNNEIKSLVEELISHDGMRRKKARGKLVDIGSMVLPFISSLTKHPKYTQRWEAIKTMEEIAHPDSIPVFIEALEDHERDIRWIAQEGLIKLGQQSIKPLLETLVEKSDSVFVLAGAHHFFHDMKKSGQLPAGFPVDELLTLLGSAELKGSMVSMVLKLLHDMKS